MSSNAPASLSIARRDKAVAAVVEKFTRPSDSARPFAVLSAYCDASAELRDRAADRAVAQLEQGQVTSLLGATRLAYQQIMQLCAGPDMSLFQMRVSIRGPLGQILRWAKPNEIRFAADPYFEDVDHLSDYFAYTMGGVVLLDTIDRRRRIEIGVSSTDPRFRSAEVEKRDAEIDQILASSVSLPAAANMGGV